MSYLVLGPFEVRDGDSPVDLHGGQQRKLLAILLLHGGEAVSSDVLIEELWGGKPPETAAKALQGYVSGLRKQLGAETVETVGSGYRLAVAREDVDAHRFEELLAEARPLERGPAAEKLRAALALWRGPAFADFAYDDFARHEIERLDELRGSCIERRIDLELALGYHDDLVPELEALVHAFPLRERLRAHLMVALYRSGRQAEALDAYRDARTALSDELGLEPSEELQALQRSILDHDAALAAPPRVDVPRPADAPASAGDRGLRRPLLAVALGLAILGGVAAALVLTLGTNKAAAFTVPPNSVARIDEAGTRIESFVGVGRSPSGIAVGAGAVWVTNGAVGTVTKLNPATGRKVDTVGVGHELYGVAVGFGFVWVADGNDGTVTQIDPKFDQTAGTVPQGGQSTLGPDPVFYVAVDPAHVWATRGHQLLRIDPKSLAVRVWADVENPTGLTTGGGYVWVTTQAGNLLRIDPQHPNDVAPQALPGTGSSPVYVRGSLWMVTGPEVLQIDPSSLSLENAYHVVGIPVVLAAGERGLWAVANNGNLVRIGPGGPTTNPLHVGSPKSLAGVVASGGSIWVAVSARG